MQEQKKDHYDAINIISLYLTLLPLMSMAIITGSTSNDRNLMDPDFVSDIDMIQNVPPGQAASLDRSME